MTDTIRGIVLPPKRVLGDSVEDRLTDAVADVLLPSRYLLRDESGTVTESPTELFERVARGVARAEAQYDGDPTAWASRFSDLMTSLEFVPNSPTLMNAGTDRQQLAACFVMSPRDSLELIFETLGHAATVMQGGGGVGYSFSALRPRGDRVGSTRGIASGPVSFMRVFDSMCEQIRQGGRRRGAQMGVLRVDHPDIGRFCLAKHAAGSLENFNLSVGVTDAFLDALETDGSYQLVNPRTGHVHRVTEATASVYSPSDADAPDDEVPVNVWRDLTPADTGIDHYRPRCELTVGEAMTLPAGFVWALIVDGGWRVGEPGLFMLDVTNRDHSFDVTAHPGHRIEATNPCGEQGLEAYEACTLGHVNLSLLAANRRTPWFTFDTGEPTLRPAVEAFLAQAIEWPRFTRIIRDGTRFLDDVVTASSYPIPAIERAVADGRKIGLGIMGLAQLFVQLGVRYGTPPSVEIARQLMAHVNRESTRMSHELAIERGTFPSWTDSKYADPIAYPDWFTRHTGQDATDWTDGFPLRNHSTTSIAPCGTTGMIANTSGGCEPLFDVVYYRRVSQDDGRDTVVIQVDDYLLEVAEANGVDPDDLSSAAIDRLAAGTLDRPHDLPIPSEIADLFVTAREVPPEAHVRMQAALQTHVDSAISKTVNLPHDATPADVESAFTLAIDLGCKGITVYRDRSRTKQVLTTHPASRPPAARCCPS